MKKTILFIGLAAVLSLSSCITTSKTARTLASSSSIKNATVADLRVTGERITKTIQPSKAIQRGGLENVKQAVIQEALNDCEMADVLVEPEFVIESKRNLFGTRITSITVTGRPAHYENFRTLHDSVWASPGFHGQPNVVYVEKAPKGYADYGNYGEKKSGLGAALGAVGNLLGGGKHRNRTKEDTGWRRSGFGAYLTAIGGSEKWKVDSHESYGKGHWFDEVEDLSGAFVGGLLTVGYNVTPHWFLGVGSGCFYGGSQEICNVPVYADVRFNFSSRKRSTWFIDYKIGGNTVTNKDWLEGGYFTGLSIGYDFGHFELALLSMASQIKTDGKRYTGNDDYYYKAKWNLSHVGLTLGIAF